MQFWCCPLVIQNVGYRLSHNEHQEQKTNIFHPVTLNWPMKHLRLFSEYWPCPLNVTNVKKCDFIACVLLYVQTWSRLRQVKINHKAAYQITRLKVISFNRHTPDLLPYLDTRAVGKKHGILCRPYVLVQLMSWTASPRHDCRWRRCDVSWWHVLLRHWQLIAVSDAGTAQRCHDDHSDQSPSAAQYIQYYSNMNGRPVHAPPKQVTTAVA